MKEKRLKGDFQTMTIRPLFYLILMSTLAIILSGCETNVAKEDSREKATQLNHASQSKPNQNNTAKAVSVLEKKIADAKNRQGWDDYVLLSDQLWAQADSANQAAIEYQVWQTLKAIPPVPFLLLKEDPANSVELNDWLAFVKASRQPALSQKQTLQDIALFQPSAIFNSHLNASLQQRLTRNVSPHHIAIFLPFTGPYQKISIQIRNGIIKNQMLHSPNTILSFYNSSQPDQMADIYQTAKTNGADFFIGPVQKESIQALIDAKIPSDNIITLNENALLPQFPYHSMTEDLQITQKLCQQNFKHIAILTRNTPSNTKLAVNISKRWQQLGNQLVLQTYPAKRPNLRKALGSVINEKQSEDRKNNLQWAFKEKLFFTPRTRQDLDAIVILGNSRQIAVFRPQFDFFDLTLPVYSSSKLTPNTLHQTKPNKDLAQTIFPSFPAALKPTTLQSKFEAFGWDSLTLANQHALLAPGICLNTGMTGKLSKDGRDYDHQFSWAKYNRQGIIKPLDASAPNSK